MPPRGERGPSPRFMMILIGALVSVVMVFFFEATKTAPMPAHGAGRASQIATAAAIGAAVGWFMGRKMDGG